MNILIIQEAGRHKKNKNFRESLNFKRSLERIDNIKVTVWGLDYENYNTPFYNLEQWCDVIFIIENYTPQWLPVQQIRDSKKLKIFWSIDSHCVLDMHKNICKNLKINILLNSTEGFIADFKDCVDKSFWFPNAYPDDVINPIADIIKINDIGFCGNLGNRIDWVMHLHKFNIKQDVFVIGDSMVRAINSYKIHFNRNISNDINYRTFETTGCKTLLLTNYTPGLEKLFNIGQEIVVYDNINDLEEKIKFLLNNKQQRKQIEECGYSRAKKYHTYDIRSKTLIDIITEQ